LNVPTAASDDSPLPGVVVGGTASGVGKTVASLAIMQGLRSRGYAAQPTKAGPDSIDPSHHEAVTGTPLRTLDPWLEGGAGMRRTYHSGAGDLCVVEGVMGLYDGDCSSTAAVASALDLPVVLVVDASAGTEGVSDDRLHPRHSDVAGAMSTSRSRSNSRSSSGVSPKPFHSPNPSGESCLASIPQPHTDGSTADAEDGAFP
jgi:cobyrinic acid a,c-diamide synthase